MSSSVSSWSWSGSGSASRTSRALAAALIAGATSASVLAGPSSPPAAAATGDPVVVAGGDIACAAGAGIDPLHCQQSATGQLLVSLHPEVTLPLGDTQYESGATADYTGSYDTTGWGALRATSRPAPGNHEYATAGAAGYYAYFGANAGDPAKGYYSYDVLGPGGAFRWHLVALNSECAVLGNGSTAAGCGVGSPQETWLRADLARSTGPGVCTLAYWHRPRFTSGSAHASSTTYSAFWDDLYAVGADVVLNGHSHDYERFDPQTSTGAPDARGPREFVVGTGGKDLVPFGPPVANSVVRDATTFGVLALTLHAGSYDWTFMPLAGGAQGDAGSATCHPATTRDTTPPSVTTGLTAAVAATGGAALQWTPATDDVGVTGYAVYRGTGTAAPALLTTTTTSTAGYTDASAQAGTTYTYQVAAVDAAGNVGPRSSTASVSLPPVSDTTPPTVPGGLRADAVSASEVDLSWSASTDAASGVSGYRVWRQGPGTATLTLVGSTTVPAGGGGTTYADLTVAPASTYTYAVDAVDRAGNTSATSATATATTPAATGTRTFTFPVAADATLDELSPTRTAGSSTSLLVDGSPVDDALLRFSVATTPDCRALVSATLQLLDQADGSSSGGDVYTTAALPDWTEPAVSSSNAPARGTKIASLKEVLADAATSVDVTAGTALGREVNFRIGSASADGVRYWSKEAATPAARPRLVVVCRTGPPPPGTTTVTATASADASIVQASPTTNYGADSKLVVDGSPVTDTLLAFTLTAPGCTTVDNALLRLTDNNDPSVAGGDVWTSTPFPESSVTWSGAPAQGTRLASVGAVTSGGVVTLAVTAGVGTTNGTVAFRVSSGNADGAHYYPREATASANRPLLTVTCH